MHGFLQSLRYTLRPLLKSPGFTHHRGSDSRFGIGANTAIFSLINCVLLKPLPYPKADRLVQIFRPFRNFDTGGFDYPDFVDYSTNQRTFDGLAAFSYDDFNLASQGDPQRISGVYVSGTFFRVLGRPFLMGRPIVETDDRPDAPAVVVLSEHLWRSGFNADPKIVGTHVSLNSKNFQVIGVTPGQADESAKVDLYVPLSQDPDFDSSKKIRRGASFYSCIGRLKDRVTLQQAQADLEVIRQNLVASYPATDAGFGIRLVPYLDSVVTDYSATVWLLEGAVTCLLLITCANVANLLLARAQERRKEMTIRAALGASRIKLASQILAESTVLATAGGIIGLLMAIGALEAIKELAPPDVLRFQEIRLDGGSLAFVVAVTLFTALASGLFPAWTVPKTNLTSALKREGERAGTAGPQRQRSQAILVAGQVALTCILLTGAGLLARSLQALQSIPLGFKTDHILTADVYLARTKYSSQPARKIFFDALLDKVSHLPGVISAGLDDALPFTRSVGAAFGIAGQPDPNLEHKPLLESQIVSRDYFRTVGIPLLRGRLFDEEDQADKQKAVIVSESLAQHFFPGQDAIGKQIHDTNSIGLKQNFYTIVGVVPNIQHDSPDAQWTPFQAYYLYAQDPYAPLRPIDFGTLVLHTEGDPLSLIGAVRESVATIDPTLPLSDVDTFDHLVQKAFVSRRLGMTVVSIFSGVALFLASVGLYGVLSYSVSLRKQEISVRMAMGAPRSNIIKLVIQRGLKIVAIGLVIGLVAALALSHLMESMLFSVSAADPISLGLSVLVLGLAALLACLLPALRATRINPITALRE